MTSSKENNSSGSKKNADEVLLQARSLFEAKYPNREFPNYSLERWKQVAGDYKAQKQEEALLRHLEPAHTGPLTAGHPEAPYTENTQPFEQNPYTQQPQDRSPYGASSLWNPFTQAALDSPYRSGYEQQQSRGDTLPRPALAYRPFEWPQPENPEGQS